MRRTLVIFLTLLLLAGIIAQANHLLAARHTYLFVGGLFVTFAALRLPYGAGLGAVALGGLLVDSTLPVRFGTLTRRWCASQSAPRKLISWSKFRTTVAASWPSPPPTHRARAACAGCACVRPGLVLDWTSQAARAAPRLA